MEFLEVQSPSRGFFILAYIKNPRELGIFENFGIFILGIGNFYPRELGIFKNLRIFIPGIFAESQGYLQSPPPPRIFIPGIFWGRVFFSFVGISHQKATYAR